MATLLTAVARTLWAQAPTEALERPAWAGASVPDDVWTLAEAARGERDGRAAVELARRAEAAARSSLSDAPDDLGLRFALAVVLGIRVERESGRDKVRVASDFHRELTAVLEVDPEHAMARHLLGRLHVGIQRMNRITRFLATSLLGGGARRASSWEEAERHLSFAEDAAPEISEHHLELGRLYEATDRPELAITELEHVLALTPASAGQAAARNGATRLR